MGKSVRLTKDFKEDLVRKVVDALFITDIQSLRDSAIIEFEKILDEYYSELKFDWKSAEKLADYIRWTDRVDIEHAIDYELTRKVSNFKLNTSKVWNTTSRWLLKMSKKYPITCSLGWKDGIDVTYFYPLKNDEKRARTPALKRVEKVFLAFINKINEAYDAFENLTSALMLVNTYKQLDEQFPELAPYYEAPDGTVTALVPIDVVNRVKNLFKEVKEN